MPFCSEVLRFSIQVTNSASAAPSQFQGSVFHSISPAAVLRRAFILSHLSYSNSLAAAASSPLLRPLQPGRPTPSSFAALSTSFPGSRAHIPPPHPALLTWLL